MTKPITYRPTGLCPDCQRQIGLRRSDGVIGFHRRRDVWVGDTGAHMMSPQPACPGWTKKPGVPA